MSKNQATRLLTPSQAASIFQVSSKTVTRWEKSGWFPKTYQGRTVVVRTLGGHRRYDEAAMEALAAGVLQPNTGQGGQE